MIEDIQKNYLNGSYDVADFIKIENEKIRKKRILNHNFIVELIWNLEKETKPATREATESIWRRYLESKFYKSKKHLDIQRRILDQIYRKVLIAFKNNAVVQYSRNKTPENNYYDTKMKMIDFLEDEGMFFNQKSDSYNPKKIALNLSQSKLVPLPDFFKAPQQRILLAAVEKEIGKEVSSQLMRREDWIKIIKKENGKRIRSDVPWTNLEVIRRVELLKEIHRSWMQFKVWYKPFKNGKLGNYKLLERNQPFCSFTNNLDLGGRLYTKTGITTLKPEERATVIIQHGKKRFKSSELDIKNQHPFLIYATLKNYNYQGDAYNLLSDAELESRGLDKASFRELVKVIFSAAINSQNCVSAARRKADPAGKRGKKLEDAEKIQKLLDRCKITFSEIYKLIIKKHPLLKDVFHKDKTLGLKLQKIDSNITLQICSHFARQNKLCLPIHDSYVVAEGDEIELKKVINKYYKRAVKYSPRIEKKA